MTNKFVLASVGCLVVLSFYMIAKNSNGSTEDVKTPAAAAGFKNVYTEVVGSSTATEHVSKQVIPKQTSAEELQLAVYKPKSVLKQRLCHQHTDDCVADTTLNFSTELSNTTGDLQTEAVGILLQSANFDHVFSKLSAEKSIPEAFQSESMLQKYLQAEIGAMPTAIEQTACSNTVCIVEVDVDSQTDLTALNAIVNSDRWPMGSSVTVPVYVEQRLKFRVVTSRVHQVGTGVSIGAPKDS